MDLQEQNMTTIEYNVTSTTEGNYSDIDEDSVPKEVIYVLLFYFTLIFFASVLSLVTCVVAFVSWIMIPKWRTFKNYVFLNLILSYTASYTFLVAEALNETSYVMNYFLCSFSCWLFIASIVSYMDIVKVFSSNVTRRKLKCTLFAWGVPLPNTLLNVVEQECYSFSDVVKSGDNNYYFILILLLCNFFIYIKVFYSLFRVARFRSRARYMQKVQVATFTFFMSGSMILPPLVLSEFGMTFYTSLIVGVMPFVQTIALSTCFLMLKSNRMMWSELCCHNTENVKQGGINST